MKCDLCGQEIKPNQDRHSDGSGTYHGSCETGDKSSDNAHKSYSIRLNFFEGVRVRLWGENWKEG